MQQTNIFAYTPPGSYPPYLSVNRLENGDVSVTVRTAPKVVQGSYICSHKPRPGACTAGGPTCNNYCNMAPQKGPMQDHPLPCEHTIEGTTSVIVIPAADWPAGWVV